MVTTGLVPDPMRAGNPLFSAFITGGSPVRSQVHRTSQCPSTPNRRPPTTPLYPHRGNWTRPQSAVRLRVVLDPLSLGSLTAPTVGNWGVDVPLPSWSMLAGYESPSRRYPSQPSSSDSETTTAAVPKPGPEPSVVAVWIPDVGVVSSAVVVADAVCVSVCTAVAV